jgi:Protein of unknown function (DUF1638)
MKLKCLSCEALARLAYLCAAQSPHIVEVELFRIGLHNEPPNLRAQLQAHIDGVDGQKYDAIVLVYGLCGKATAGLTARDLPLVIPRAHDCITLFLGSRQRYQDQFENQPGTYWYTQDYIERRENVATPLSLGAGMDSANIESLYDEYVEKYGEDNAAYLMEVMGAWQSHYQRAVYIEMGVGDGSGVERQTQEEASKRGWRFERLSGNLTLVQRLLAAEWDDDFLVVEPGQQIGQAYDETVMCSVTADQSPIYLSPE